MGIEPNDLERFRRDTPGCSRRIHLNNAGAGLMPAPVLEVVRAHLALESEIGGYEASAARVEAIQSTYDAVAGLLGCRARNIAIVENATAAYAQALSAIPFERGDLLLTSANDYISNQIMFLSLARRLGIEIVRAPDCAEGGVDPVALAGLIRRRRPKLVALTHVPTNSGLVQPVEEVGRICRELDIWYLVDACQSVGQLAVDVREIGCDFLSATSRKFLRGPRGSGFLYVSDRALEAGLEPLFIDMQGARWVSANKYAADPGARRFENWEFAYALLLGTGAAARYATAIGIGAIAERTSRLAADLRLRLSREAGLRALDRGRMLCGITTVEIPGWGPQSFHDELERRGVNSSVSLHQSAVIDFEEKQVDWALRLSPHYYNTEGEIEEAAGRIVEILRGSKD